MHVTKNVFDNIIGTLLDMPRKMKDGLKSRNDLVQFGLRPELHFMLRPNGKHYLPPASYSLIVEEKNILSVPAWGASTHMFLVQHHQASLCEKLVYVIGRKELDDLKAYMIETICILEMCFPPFFDMKENLMIHLVDQILPLGPLYLHSMFPYEWFLANLKAYVRNCAKPQQKPCVEGQDSWCLPELCHSHTRALP
jgi:hypothetical protein